MSRPARAGSAGKPVTIRATDAERERWERAARIRDVSLSDWIRPVLGREADAVLGVVARLAKKR